MTLDEIEKLARKEVANSHMLTYAQYRDVCRTLLAVMPVVRAAATWEQTPDGRDYKETVDLAHAVCNMRLTLEAK